ncbi:hypothetical protein CALCODRAFT_178022 [Calocera cornea HHB12733]|uniref:Uncharacterized protein n=1 Tax=Calocera cornea HHB12733 TaxID=1353952 RepID=A0A165CER3_9BASI|nr:hypothetical protein CALCODRAFT_178022 [Calocera cornea HHB12733]
MWRGTGRGSSCSVSLPARSPCLARGAVRHCGRGRECPLLLLLPAHADPLPVEESEYSAYIIRNPDISFLILPEALTHVPVHLFTPSTLKYHTPGGVFRTYQLDPPTTPALPALPVLDLRALVATSPRTRVFSPKGITRPVSIFAASYEYGLWFPLQFATHYNHFHPIPDGWRRIVGRGGGYRGGEEGVWERLEPPREAREALPVGLGEGEGAVGRGVPLVEGLYIHWFEEKWNGGASLCFYLICLPSPPSLPLGRTLTHPRPDRMVQQPPRAPPPPVRSPRLRREARRPHMGHEHRRRRLAGRGRRPAAGPGPGRGRRRRRRRRDRHRPGIGAGAGAGADPGAGGQAVSSGPGEGRRPAHEHDGPWHA